MCIRYRNIRQLEEKTGGGDVGWGGKEGLGRMNGAGQACVDHLP